MFEIIERNWQTIAIVLLGIGLGITIILSMVNNTVHHAARKQLRARAEVAEARLEAIQALDAINPEDSRKHDSAKDLREFRHQHLPENQGEFPHYLEEQGTPNLNEEDE